MATNKTNQKINLEEPDKFMSLASRIIEFAEQERTKLIWAAGAVIALILIIFGIRYSSIKSEEHASMKLAAVHSKYTQLLQSKDAASAYTDVESDFQEILNKYSGTKSAQLAKIRFADISYDAGKYDKALGLYEDALKKFENDPFVRSLIMINIAFCFQAQNKLDQAISYLEKLRDDEKGLRKDEVYYNLGLLYEKTGQTQKSQDAYQTLISKYKESIFLDIAKNKITG